MPTPHRPTTCRAPALTALLVGVLLSGCGGPATTGSPATIHPVPGPTSPTPGVVTPTVAPATPAPATPGPATPAPDPTGPGDPLASRTVVLDPGHNGANSTNPGRINQQVDAGGFRKACNTTGTASSGISESSVNWAVAQQVAQRLRARGVTVVMTRQDDTGWGPCIDARGRLARQSGADVLLSIHADGAAAGARGFHVITPGPVPGYTDGIVAPSAEFGTRVRDALTGQGFPTADYVGREGLVTRGDLGTLNHARVPTAMVEMGNMHNTQDFQDLTSPAGQARYADALTAGVLGYLGG